MSGRRRRTSRMSGMTLSWSWSNFHRPDNTPNVTSNFPPVHSLICRAVFSTSRTSALTGTGRTPASRFARETSLSGIHVLITFSNRVNSANTSSNACVAADSSAVHAVRVRVEPIERRDAEISLAVLKPCATDGCAPEDGSLRAQPSAAVHVSATETKTVFTSLHPILIRFIVIL